MPAKACTCGNPISSQNKRGRPPRMCGQCSRLWKSSHTKSTCRVVACEYCKQYRRKDEKRYCSIICKESASEPNLGRLPRLALTSDYVPRRAKRYATLCRFCGSALIVHASHKAGTNKTNHDYCDIECANADKSFAYIDLKSTRQRKLNGEIRTVRLCQLCMYELPQKTRKRRCRKCDASWIDWTRECQKNYQVFLYKDQQSEFSATCQHCACEFSYWQTPNTHRKKRKFCSARCADKHRKQNRNHRLRDRTAAREKIGLGHVAEEFSWRCAFCNVKCVTPRGKNLSNEATIDHVIPLSKGGSHSRDNVQLLCRRCNSNKSDVIGKHGQLMLIF